MEVLEAAGEAWEKGMRDEGWVRADGKMPKGRQMGKRGISSPSLTLTLQHGQRPGHRKSGEHQGAFCVQGRH